MTRRIAAALLAALLSLSFAMSALAQFSGDPDAIEEAALSVVMLNVYDRDGHLQATGSGFVLFDERTVVTNYHVIEGSYAVTAESDVGEQYPVPEILIADQRKDLAILRFGGPTGMKPLAAAEALPKRGSAAVAIGSPKGYKNTVSIGNVSAVFTDDTATWVQFTAAVSRGSSGGALFNDDGDVIGVTTLADETANDVYFAVSVREVVDLWEKWDGTTSRPVSQYGSVTVGRKAVQTPAEDDGAAPGPWSAPEAASYPQERIRLDKGSVYGYRVDLAGVLDDAVFQWSSERKRGQVDKNLSTVYVELLGKTAGCVAVEFDYYFESESGNAAGTRFRAYARTTGNRWKAGDRKTDFELIVSSPFSYRPNRVTIAFAKGQTIDALSVEPAEKGARAYSGSLSFSVRALYFATEQAARAYAESIGIG